jgi:hypothetical protein
MSNSQADFFNHDSPIGSITFTAMTAGIGAFTVLISQSPSFGPNSQVLGFTRITTGGTVGTPFLAAIDFASSGSVQSAVIKSTSATDTSVYKLFYVNPTPQPNVKAALGLL